MSQQDLSSKLWLICLMQCFRTGKESLHRITLSSDDRTTPSDSVSFPLPHLVPSQLASSFVPLLACPVAMHAGAAHCCFPGLSSFQLRDKGPSFRAPFIRKAWSLRLTGSLYDKSSTIYFHILIYHFIESTGKKSQ